MQKNIQTKYPLIIKEEWVKTVRNLEGKEISTSTHWRKVKPSRVLDTKQEIDDYIKQMGAARMHYSNIMDLPYSVEYAVDIHHPLYDYAVIEQDSLPAKNDKVTIKKTVVDADLIIQGELGELPEQNK